MGRPSDKKRSAQRPGKRERARVKNFRGGVSRHVPGVGIVHVKYGRKKAKRVTTWLCRDLIASPSIGEPVKSESQVETQTARI